MKAESVATPAHMPRFLSVPPDNGPLALALVEGVASANQLSKKQQSVLELLKSAKTEYNAQETNLYSWQRWVFIHADGRGLVGLIARVALFVLNCFSHRLQSMRELKEGIKKQEIQLQQLEKSFDTCLRANCGEIVKASRKLYTDIPFHLRKDRDFVLAMVKIKGRLLEDVEPEFKKDEEIVLAAVENNYTAIQYAHPSMLQVKKIMKIVTQKVWPFIGMEKQYGPMILLMAKARLGDPTATAIYNSIPIRPFVSGKELLSDKELVLAAVIENPNILKCVDHNLWKDRDIILTAIGHDSHTLGWADESLRKDPSFIKTVVMKKGRALLYADAALRADPEIALLAVQQTGRALEHVMGSAINQTIITAALQQTGEALQFAPQATRDDKQMVKLAILTYGKALQFAAKSWQSDKEIVLLAVQQDGMALQFADDELRNDADVVAAALKQNPLAIQFASLRHKKNSETVQSVVSVNGLALQYVDDSLKGKGSVVDAAITENPLALQFASPEVQEDERIVFEAVCHNYQAFQYVHKTLKDDKKFVTKLLDMKIPNAALLLLWAGKRVRSDETIALKAIALDEEAGHCIDGHLLANVDFVKAALKLNPKFKNFISRQLFKTITDPKDLAILGLETLQVPIVLSPKTAVSS